MFSLMFKINFGESYHHIAFLSFFGKTVAIAEYTGAALLCHCTYKEFDSYALFTK